MIGFQPRRRRASTMLKAKLSRDATQALKGGKSLKAQVWGSGIKSGLVKLKS